MIGKSQVRNTFLQPRPSYLADAFQINSRKSIFVLTIKLVKLQNGKGKKVKTSATCLRGNFGFRPKALSVLIGKF